MFKAIISALCLAATCHANSFTLESAVPYALANNSDLAAARIAIEQARGRLLHAGRLSNPELESELQPNIRGREFSFSAGVLQRFPLTNRLMLEKAVSQAEFALAQAEVQVAERKLAAAVQTAGLKLLLLQENRSLKIKQITSSREVAASARRTASRGEGSGLEAAHFELDAQQLSLDLLQLDSERTSLEGEVRPLLGLSPSQTVEFHGTLPAVAIPRQQNPSFGARPDFHAAQLRLEAAQQGIGLARAGKWEDAGVGVAAGIDRSEDAPEGLQTEGMVGLKFSLPLPFWNKMKGESGKPRPLRCGQKRSYKH